MAQGFHNINWLEQAFSIPEERQPQLRRTSSTPSLGLGFNYSPPSSLGSSRRSSFVTAPSSRRSSYHSVAQQPVPDNLMMIAEGGTFRRRSGQITASEAVRAAQRSSNASIYSPLITPGGSEISLPGQYQLPFEQRRGSLESKVGYIKKNSKTFQQARMDAHAEKAGLRVEKKRGDIAMTSQKQASERHNLYKKAKTAEEKSILEKNFLKENQHRLKTYKLIKHDISRFTPSELKQYIKELKKPGTLHDAAYKAVKYNTAINNVKTVGNATLKTAKKVGNTTFKAVKTAANVGNAAVFTGLNVSRITGSVGSIVSHFDKKTGQHILDLTNDIGTATVGIAATTSTVSKVTSSVTNLSKAFQTAENAIVVDTKIANNTLKVGATAGALASGGLNFVADAALVVSFAVDAGLAIKSYFDFQKQKDIEEHPEKWGEYFDYYVKEENYVKYTFGTYKGEANYNKDSAYDSEHHVVVDIFGAEVGDAYYKQTRWPTMDEIKSITEEGANQYHYKLLSDDEYAAFHYDNRELSLRLILRNVEYNEAFYGITLGSLHRAQTGKSLYFVENPDKIDYSNQKIIRYVEIPTILGNSESESIEKFVFQRNNDGSKFTEMHTYMVSGTAIGTSYYDWMSLKENQQSAVIYQMWKNNYPNISFENIKTAFADPLNPATNDELSYMNTNKSSLEEAKKYALKQESSEVKQLAQTPELLESTSKQLIEFLENVASDPQNVYSYLNTIGVVYGGWTEKSWSFFWDNIYNVWRQTRGLPMVERNGESNSIVANNNMYIEGEPITPQSQLFAPLYKSQSQAFKKQFHGKSRR